MPDKKESSRFTAAFVRRVLSGDLSATTQVLSARSDGRSDGVILYNKVFELARVESFEEKHLTVKVFSSYTENHIKALVQLIRVTAGILKWKVSRAIPSSIHQLILPQAQKGISSDETKNIRKPRRRNIIDHSRFGDEKNYPGRQIRVGYATKGARRQQRNLDELDK